jgi:hypothetical protein
MLIQWQPCHCRMIFNEETWKHTSTRSVNGKVSFLLASVHSYWQQVYIGLSIECGVGDNMGSVIINYRSSGSLWTKDIHHLFSASNICFSHCCTAAQLQLTCNRLPVVFTRRPTNGFHLNNSCVKYAAVLFKLCTEYFRSFSEEPGCLQIA